LSNIRWIVRLQDSLQVRREEHGIPCERGIDQFLALAARRVRGRRRRHWIHADKAGNQQRILPFPGNAPLLQIQTFHWHASGFGPFPLFFPLPSATPTQSSVCGKEEVISCPLTKSAFSGS
jgi:hypothetical protein